MLFVVFPFFCPNDWELLKNFTFFAFISGTRPRWQVDSLLTSNVSSSKCPILLLLPYISSTRLWIVGSFHPKMVYAFSLVISWISWSHKSSQAPYIVAETLYRLGPSTSFERYLLGFLKIMPWSSRVHQILAQVGRPSLWLSKLILRSFLP